MAFFALQMAVFTCGFDIHVHAADSEIGHIAEHVVEKVQGDHNEQNTDADDHGCHVHASHTFTASNIEPYGHAALLSSAQAYGLADLNLKSLPFRIEHPPKLRHS